LGKVKNKSHSELEHLRGLVKELKKENGQLRRQLKDAGKYQHQYEDVVENNILKDIEPEVVHKIANCPECHKGSLDLKLTIMDKDYYECDVCSFRKSIKHEK
jgi:predicted  nucleic acid-binding Zn ribbon protein